MISLKKTTASDKDFLQLVTYLDEELRIRDGAEHEFFAALNKAADINYVIVAYENEVPVGCGALREYDKHTMEIKRMFVPRDMRGKGIATAVLKNLEEWAAGLNYHKCILETGKTQPEAIAL